MPKMQPTAGMRSTNLRITEELYTVIRELTATGRSQSEAIESYLWEHPDVREEARRLKLRRCARPRRGGYRG